MSLKPSVKIGDIFINRQNCKMVVVDYTDSKNVLIEFDDNYKYRMVTRVAHLKRGHVKNPFYPLIFGIGFIGAGTYKEIKNGIRTIEYNVWSNMMERCYDQKYHARHPTYEDCTVCNEWHNFQNFAEWYTSQEYYGKGYHLDKDLLIDGNKVYSPSTCVLAPHEINTLFNTNPKIRGLYPVGVSFEKKFNKFSAKLKKYGKKVHLGYFSCPNEASQVYQKAKKEHVKNIALEWQDRIDEKLFNALMVKTA